MSMHSRGMLIVLSLLSTTISAQDKVNYVGQFISSVNKIPPAPWRIIQFDKKIPATQYRIISWDGVFAIEAKANASMALLAKPLLVSLIDMPILCWRWRVDAPLKTADMTTKSGDDYAARVYLAFNLPSEKINFITRAKLKLARTLYGSHVPDAALNYVWDNRYPVGTKAPNAYTEQTQMIVLRSGAKHTGTWVTERRNILADAILAFGTNRINPTLLAVAADTDNTGEHAHSGFADLHFVSSGTKCNFSMTKQ